MDHWFNYGAAYIAAAYILLHLPLPKAAIRVLFALLNIICSFASFFVTPKEVQWELFLLCMVLVLYFYASLRYYLFRPGFYPLALAIPAIALAVVKVGFIPATIGISYLAFRLSYLVFEVQHGKIRPPALIDYLGFTFFPLTFLIGPISPYRLYDESLNHPSREATPLVRSLGRILVGMIKVFLFAELFHTQDFATLWFDGYYHGIHDFIICCFASGLYLYFNFSGACDIVIGGAGILNIQVKENFNNPLLSRNMQDFWNRTHITLSHYFRDIVFLPGLHFLNRATGGKYIHLHTVTMLMVTFLLLGLWHGVDWNFVMLGLLNGLGLSIFHLYSVLWKKLPAGFQHFSNTAPMVLLSRIITMSYVSLTFVFFENSWDKIIQMGSLFRW